MNHPAIAYVALLAESDEPVTVVQSARAMRRHHRHRVASNRRKIAVARGMDHVAEHSDNMLAVKDPFDCGGRCLMCHGEKILGRGARRQNEKRESERDILAGLDEHQDHA